MLCPNCTTPMNASNFDNQAILHCSNCGGSFFEENSINRISLTSARKLAEDKKNNVVLGLRKVCPKDGSPLLALQNNEAVPPNVVLLHCANCRGIFTYPDDLLQFKKAQKVKIDFFKIWSLPLPSLKSVLVFSFMVFTIVSLFTAYSAFLNRASKQIQAEDLIKKIDISKSGRFLLIIFSTNGEFRSEIIFKNNVTGAIIKKTASSELKKVHFLVTDEISTDEDFNYQIILYDKQGREIKTGEQKPSIQ